MSFLITRETLAVSRYLEFCYVQQKSRYDELIIWIDRKVYESSAIAMRPVRLNGVVLQHILHGSKEKLKPIMTRQQRMKSSIKYTMTRILCRK
jgi:hypothetical protein